MDAITAYQVTSMLQGAVSRGTSAASVGQLGLNLAGKTGTTNEAKDVWYIGYSPAHRRRLLHGLRHTRARSAKAPSAARSARRSSSSSSRRRWRGRARSPGRCRRAATSSRSTATPASASPTTPRAPTCRPSTSATARSSWSAPTARPSTPAGRWAPTCRSSRACATRPQIERVHGPRPVPGAAEQSVARLDVERRPLLSNPERSARIGLGAAGRRGIAGRRWHDPADTRRSRACCAGSSSRRACCALGARPRRRRAAGAADHAVPDPRRRLLRPLLAPGSSAGCSTTRRLGPPLRAWRERGADLAAAPRRWPSPAARSASSSSGSAVPHGALCTAAVALARRRRLAYVFTRPVLTALEPHARTEESPMRAETERLVDEIEKSLALLRQRLGWETAEHRLEELNAMTEDPGPLERPGPRPEADARPPDPRRRPRRLQARWPRTSPTRRS